MTAFRGYKAGMAHVVHAMNLPKIWSKYKRKAYTKYAKKYEDGAKNQEAGHAVPGLQCNLGTSP